MSLSIAPKSVSNTLHTYFRQVLISFGTSPHKFTLEESYAASPTELIPITIMNKALSLRFRYHFETSKPTNRPDKVSIGSLKRLYPWSADWFLLLAWMVSFSCQKCYWCAFTIFDHDSAAYRDRDIAANRVSQRYLYQRADGRYSAKTAAPSSENIEKTELVEPYYPRGVRVWKDITGRLFVSASASMQSSKSYFS